MMSDFGVVATDASVVRVASASMAAAMIVLFFIFVFALMSCKYYS